MALPVPPSTIEAIFLYLSDVSVRTWCSWVKYWLGLSRLFNCARRSARSRSSVVAKISSSFAILSDNQLLPNIEFINQFAGSLCSCERTRQNGEQQKHSHKGKPLPIKLKMHIFSFFTPFTCAWATLQHVCKRWHKAAHDPSILHNFTLLMDSTLLRGLVLDKTISPTLERDLSHICCVHFS